MEENKNKDQEQPDGFASNPEKSFEAGKKGGKEATEVTNQSGGVNNANTGASDSLGDNHSRTDPQNRPAQGEGWQSDRVGSDDSGSKQETTS